MTDISTTQSSETFTIQEVAKRSGFSEPTLRYYEKIGLIETIPRDKSSGHRRYSVCTVQTIEALACLHKSGLGIVDMRTYLGLLEHGQQAAAAQRLLFEKHALRVANEIALLQIRQRYLDGKVQLWAARERGDKQAEATAAESLKRIAAELREIH